METIKAALLATLAILLKGILGVFYVVGMAIALIFGAMLGVLQVVFSLNASREKKNNKKLHTRRK